MSYCVDGLLPRMPELSAVTGALPVGGAQRIVFVLHFCLLAGLLEFARAPGAGRTLPSGSAHEGRGVAGTRESAGQDG